MTELEQEIAHLKELQAKHRKNIRRLEEQLASYGMKRPLDLLNELEFEQEQFSKVEKQLEELAARARTREATPTPAEPREVGRREEPTAQGDWDVFISHAWEDKEDIARPLAEALIRKGLRVWYDEFTLTLGDSLRRSIDRGLAQSRYGVVILSPHFFAKEWPQRELDGLVAKEVSSGKVILPVWHKVTWEDVRRFSPTLADKLAVSTAKGLDAVVEEILRALRVIKPTSELVHPTVLEHLHPFEPEMIPIPAGEFLMGSDSQKDRYAKDNEQPQHTLYLPDYYLAKTPVTNAQYAAFVQATGRELPRHWRDGKPPRGKEDHPVINISWHDAMAYCRWLSEVTGKPYRLPSEAEWEKGARGSDGRIFPWGNRWDAKRCNSAEGGKGDTTPVGDYREGASPYGLLDMAGNVWEWTHSLWGEDWKEPSFKYPYDPDDGHEDLDAPDSILRVLRGGAFNNDKQDVRCAYRINNFPSERGKEMGFRVAMSSRSPVKSPAGPHAVQVTVSVSGAAAVGERATAGGIVAVGGDVHGGVHVGGKEKGK